MERKARQPQLLVWGMFGAVLCATALVCSCGQSVRGSTERSATTIQTDLARTPARGPLRISRVNPRYFEDDTGNIVYLAGSHTWDNFQDWGSADPPPKFDYEKYLAFLSRHGHNFFRLYVWEQATWVAWTNETVWFAPSPYQRTGPGTALDGRPRFDLREWNPEYFERLRTRVQEAADGGIYVSVMLFNGWSVDGKRSAMSSELQQLGLGDPWRGHPLHRDNNINEIDGGGWGNVHTLKNPMVTELQKAYVRKVVDTVGELDNVLWEISNESNADSTPWEYEMIRFIQAYEATRQKRHPVGMTAEFPGGNNADLWQSPADWISPASLPDGVYATDPPATNGRKVVVSDTDHIWGIGGSQDWVWKSFTRGLYPIFMDPYEAELLDLFPMYRNRPTGDPTRSRREPEWEAIRESLGYTRALSARMDLASMTPHGELSSSGYCLANPGLEYLVYLPAQKDWRHRFWHEPSLNWFTARVDVDLSRAAGDFNFEWFQPSTGTTVSGGRVAGAGKREFTAPDRNGGVALYIHARRGE